MAHITHVELKMVDLVPKVKRVDAIQSFVSQETILHIGQLKGRVLPVAAAKFLDSVITELGARYGDDIDQ